MIQSNFNMVQLLKEKQLIWGKAAFLQARAADKIEEQEKPFLRVSMEISNTLPKVGIKK